MYSSTASESKKFRLKAALTDITLKHRILECIASLVEVAFILWLLNCLLVSAMAHFTGWSMAVAVVTAGWVVLCAIGFIGDLLVDRKDIKRPTLREAVIAVGKNLGYLLCILAAVMLFPLVYLGVLAHGRFEGRKASRLAEERTEAMERASY